jgi:hypothetical protein
MNVKQDKAIMVIQGTGRVVTIKFVVLPELEHRTIASSLADEELAEFVGRSKYVFLVESDDPLNL